MILEFTSEAEGDLEQIADYIAEHNPRRALSFIRELRSRCEDLISNPNQRIPDVGCLPRLSGAVTF